MKKVLVALMSVLIFAGCSSKGSQAVGPSELVVGNSLERLMLQDQFGKSHTIDEDTKKVVFAFSKQVGHDCNDFFATKESEYLGTRSAVFVADVSAAPSLIRSMFIMPGLKDFAHTILVIDDADISTKYKPEGDIEKVVVVSLEKFVITAIDYLPSVSKLDEFLSK